APNGTTASCTTTARPVRITEPTIVSTSMGTRERMSITSASMPSAASASAAASETSTIRDHEPIVMSSPARTTRADPIGRGSPAGHVPELRGLVEERVEADSEEVHEHELDDRLQAGRRSADRSADERGLRDRRIADALGSELLVQTAGDGEDAA